MEYKTRFDVITGEKEDLLKKIKYNSDSRYGVRGWKELILLSPFFQIKTNPSSR